MALIQVGINLKLLYDTTTKVCKVIDTTVKESEVNESNLIPVAKLKEDDPNLYKVEKNPQKALNPRCKIPYMVCKKNRIYFNDAAVKYINGIPGVTRVMIRYIQDEYKKPMPYLIIGNEAQNIKHYSLLSKDKYIHWNETRMIRLFRYGKIFKLYDEGTEGQYKMIGDMSAEQEVWLETKDKVEEQFFFENMGTTEDPKEEDSGTTHIQWIKS